MAKKGRIERNERIKRTVSSQREKRELLKKMQKDIHSRHSFELEKVKEEFAKKLTLLKEDYEKKASSNPQEFKNSAIALDLRQDNEINTAKEEFEERKKALNKKNPNYKNFIRLLESKYAKKLNQLNFRHALEDKKLRSSSIEEGNANYKQYVQERDKLIQQSKEKQQNIIHEGSKELFTTSIAFQKIKRDGSATRIRKRCAITGRPRAYFGMFGLSRNVIRESASFGLIMGLTKSSW